MKYNLIALACAVLLAAGLSLTVVAGPTEPDTDSDGIVDMHDNCDVVANPNQADSDQDGYGQVCDQDLVGTDGKINVTDYGAFKAGYLGEAPTYNEQSDFNCDGKINVTDFGIFKADYLGTVGTSGQSCASALADGGCPGNPGCP
jgi:hypothetical protein